MGIKDNFSQAVKELWKKDGAEDNGENKNEKTAQPTELDRYLTEEQPAQVQQPTPTAQPTQAPQNVQPVQTPQDNSYQFSAGQQNSGVPLETPYYRQPQPQQTQQQQPQQSNANANAAGFGRNNEPSMGADGGMNSANANVASAANSFGTGGGFGGNNANNGNGGNNGGGGFVPPTASGKSIDAPSDTDEVTVISRNTVIDGNVRSLANMQVDGNIKGNVETTRDIEMSGKVVGDIKCNNANMSSAAMQGNMTLKGKIRMDRDTILIGDLNSQYADVNGRIRGKLEIVGKAELKRDAIVFGDINASTIAVTDGAIIQGYVNTTFLSKEDSRSVFPEAISFDNKTADKA